MRKEITVTLNDRGNELTFRIREMPATKVERWIIKLAGALSATGVFSADVADGVDAQKAIADFLLKGGLSKLGAVTKDYDEVIQPLIDELYTCVEQKVGNAYFALTPDVIDAKIEDVRTLFNLQKEIVKLHLDFFVPGAASSSTARQPSQKPQKPTALQHSQQPTGLLSPTSPALSQSRDKPGGRASQPAFLGSRP